MSNVSFLAYVTATEKFILVRNLILIPETHTCARSAWHELRGLVGTGITAIGKSIRFFGAQRKDRSRSRTVIALDEEYSIPIAEIADGRFRPDRDSPNI